MEERYVNIPERLILDKDLGDMRALVYAGLVFTKWNDNRPIRELVKFIGFVPRSGKNSTTAKFKKYKEELVSSGYLGNNFQPFTEPSNAVIYFDEFKKIVEYKIKTGSKISTGRCLLLFAFIRCNIQKSHFLGDYYAEQISKIASIIGIELKYMPRYIEVLQELGLIYSEKIPRLMDNCGQWYTNIRFFIEAASRTSSDYDCRIALEKAKSSFINRW